ncbi:MAG: radical SAM protein, partial [Planctomycetota bacterium]
MAAKYQLTTLGCKVNQYESQRYRELIESFGLSPAHHGEAPDLAVVNTCAVTSDASRSSRKAIRRFARGGRTAVVVVGCAAGAETQRLRDIEGVIAVLGHQQEIADELRGVLMARYGPSLAKPAYFDDAAGNAGGKPRLSARDDVWMIPIEPASSADAQPSVAVDSSAQIIRPSFPIVNRHSLSERIEAFAGHQRAFLKVQDGCDAHCTYCIIPSLRPRLRWKPIGAAVDEARSLLRAGYREIVVTGIFLGAYGRETAIRKRFTPVGSPLAELLAALAGVEGLERIRLSSLEPGDVDEPLLEVLATCRNCVPHLHLPLQSGSGDILRRMNRQYDAEDYLAMIDQVQAALDRPA